VDGRRAGGQARGWSGDTARQASTVTSCQGDTFMVADGQTEGLAIKLNSQCKVVAYAKVLYAYDTFPYNNKY